MFLEFHINDKSLLVNEKAIAYIEQRFERKERGTKVVKDEDGIAKRVPLIETHEYTVIGLMQGVDSDGGGAEIVVRAPYSIIRAAVSTADDIVPVMGDRAIIANFNEVTA